MLQVAEIPLPLAVIAGVVAASMAMIAVALVMERDEWWKPRAVIQAGGAVIFGAFAFGHVWVLAVFVIVAIPACLGVIVWSACALLHHAWQARKT